MQGLALVDYDNVCEAYAPGRRGRAGQRWPRVDVERRTDGLVDAITRVFRAAFPELRELDVRLYGGWTDERGIPSPAAFLLLQVVPALRGRRHGVIVRPSLATAMVQLPDVRLWGTVRLRTKPKRQKMVDGMLGCDAIFVATEGLTRVGVVTDDDDLVPALLAAHAANGTWTIWVRSRRSREGLNDRRLANRGLRIHRIEEGAHV